MKTINRKKWESTRRRGMLYFVLVKGIVLWGGFMLIAMSAFDAISGRFFWSDFGFRVLLWVAGGLVFGVVVWLTNEHLYARNEESPPPAA